MIDLLCGIVIGICIGVSIMQWRSRPWKRRITATEGRLDPRTETMLGAVEELSVNDAKAIVWEIWQLLEATDRLGRLWADYDRLGARAAVSRVAGAGPHHPLPPRLVKG